MLFASTLAVLSNLMVSRCWKLADSCWRLWRLTSRLTSRQQRSVGSGNSHLSSQLPWTPCFPPVNAVLPPSNANSLAGACLWSVCLAGAAAVQIKLHMHQVADHVAHPPILHKIPRYSLICESLGCYRLSQPRMVVLESGSSAASCNWHTIAGLTGGS